MGLIDWLFRKSEVPGKPSSAHPKRVDAQRNEDTSPIFTLDFPGVQSVNFSPDGKQIVAGSSDGRVALWDAESAVQVLDLGNLLNVWSVAYSPDSSRICTGHGAHGGPGELKILEALTGSELQSIKVSLKGIVRSVAFSPDGKFLATGTEDPTGSEMGCARIWNAHSGQCIQSLDINAAAVTCVAISPDGQMLAVSGGTKNEFGMVKIYSLRTWAEMLSLVGPTRKGSIGLHAPDESLVTAVAFSPDGKLLVAGRNDQTVQVWDAATGEVLREYCGHPGKSIKCVAFAPGGKQFATGSGVSSDSSRSEIKVWDTDTGRELLRLNAHTWSVHSCAFSPDGTRIVSGGGDKNVKVWNAAEPGAALALAGM